MVILREQMKPLALIVMIVLFIVLLACFFGREIGQTYKSRINAIYDHIHGLCTSRPEPEHDDAFYNSNEGFLTSVWGPVIWQFLHIISFNYKVNPTDEDKENYRTFVESLQFVLPCKYCRIGFTEILEAHPLTDQVMASRESFSRWMYQTHNLVNLRTKKPVYQTYEQVRDFYERFRARCDSKPVKTQQTGCVVPLYKKHKCEVKFIPL